MQRSAVLRCILRNCITFVNASQSIVVRWTSVLCSTAWGVTFLFRPRKSPKNTTRERRCRKPIAPWNGSLLPSSVFKPPSLLTLSRHADAYRSSVVIGFVMRNSCRLCKKKLSTFMKIIDKFQLVAPVALDKNDHNAVTTTRSVPGGVMGRAALRRGRQ